MITGTSTSGLSSTLDGTTLSALLGSSLQQTIDATMDALSQSETFTTNFTSLLQKHDSAVKSTKYVLVALDNIVQETASTQQKTSLNTFANYALGGLNAGTILDISGDYQERYNRVLSAFSGTSTYLLSLLTAYDTDTTELESALNTFNTALSTYIASAGIYSSNP